MKTVWIRTKFTESNIFVEVGRCSTIHHIMVRVMNTVVVILLNRYMLHEKKFGSVSA